MSTEQEMLAKESKKFKEVCDALESVWSEGYQPYIAVFTGVKSDSDSGLLCPENISGPDGVSIFNLGVQAIRNFSFDNNKCTINFSTKFGGRDTYIVIPVRCIVGVFQDKQVVYQAEEVWTTVNPFVHIGGVPPNEVTSEPKRPVSAIKSVAGNVITANFGRK